MTAWIAFRLPGKPDLSLAGHGAGFTLDPAMPNSFGKLFTVTTWGESHGPAVGVVIDGCPPRLPLDISDIQSALDRRRPGQSDIVTPRKEADRAEVLSGLFEGRTTGAPISILVRNADARPGAYDEMKEKFRPSHADFTYQAKYGVRDHRGGGRSSARETVGRVAAGAIAAKLLREAANVEIRAFVAQVHDIFLPEGEPAGFPSEADVDATAVRCPHPATAAAMIERIKAARSEGDSVGGVIRCRVRGVPPGLGEPVFDRLEADLAKAMLSLPATKGFEVGSGFAGTRLKRSEHNDTFVPKPGGGRAQKTVDVSGTEAELAARGRHDPCVLPRAVPIVEAMTALVLADHWMRQHAQTGAFPIK